MKERKPKTVVAVINLEDNCGAVLAKAKLEIPVEVSGELSPAQIETAFRTFLNEHFPTRFKV